MTSRQEAIKLMASMFFGQVPTVDYIRYIWVVESVEFLSSWPVDVWGIWESGTKKVGALFWERFKVKGCKEPMSLIH
jgi:hypothetical protein